jgi:hypothetical protein
MLVSNLIGPINGAAQDDRHCGYVKVEAAWIDFHKEVSTGSNPRSTISLMTGVRTTLKARQTVAEVSFDARGRGVLTRGAKKLSYSRRLYPWAHAKTCHSDSRALIEMPYRFRSQYHGSGVESDRADKRCRTR